jgi:aryl-alcohol dehydrogenase-like predicted oxidoreductase
MTALSRLGFGGSPLGGAFGHQDEEEGIRAVHRALELGVTLFDVSPLYGMTRAETVLGRALRGVPRDRFFLSTKVGRYGPQDFDFSADRVRRSLYESMDRLGVDRVDMVLCHDIEFVQVDQVIEETIPALRELQSRGVVEKIGVSGLPLRIYTEVLSRTRLDAILAYCHYTLFDTTLNGLLDTLDRQGKLDGMIVINAAPLSMGLLTQQGPPDWHPADEETKHLCRQAADHCRSRGADISQLGLQFALSNTRVHSTLVGMPDRRTVETNVALAEEPIDSMLLAEVQQILAPVKDRTWPSGS